MIWLAIVLASVGAGWLLGRGDAACNAQRAVASAPQDLLTAMLGLTVGLYGRDRIRLRQSYASPSLSYTGKVLLFLSLSPALAWTLSPLEWPALWLHFFAGGVAAGAALWMGNLPPKL